MNKTSQKQISQNNVFYPKQGISKPAKRIFQRILKKTKMTQPLKDDQPTPIQNQIEHKARELLLLQSQQINMQFDYETKYKTNDHHKKNTSIFNNNNINSQIQASNFSNTNKQNPFSTYNTQNKQNKNIDEKRRSKSVNQKDYTLITCYKKIQQKKKINTTQHDDKTKKSQVKSNGLIQKSFFPQSIQIPKNQSLVYLKNPIVNKNNNHSDRHQFTDIKQKYQSSLYIPSNLNDKIFHQIDEDQNRINKTRSHTIDGYLTLAFNKIKKSGNTINFKTSQPLKNTRYKYKHHRHEFTDVFFKQRSSTLQIQQLGTKNERLLQNYYNSSLKQKQQPPYLQGCLQSAKVKSYIINCLKRSRYEKLTTNKEKKRQLQHHLKTKRNNKPYKVLSKQKYNSLEQYNISGYLNTSKQKLNNKQIKYLSPIFYIQKKS